jgi:hypothetical protein
MRVYLYLSLCLCLYPHLCIDDAEHAGDLWLLHTQMRTSHTYENITHTQMRTSKLLSPPKRWWVYEAYVVKKNYNVFKIAEKLYFGFFLICLHEIFF